MEEIVWCGRKSAEQRRIISLLWWWRSVGVCLADKFALCQTSRKLIRKLMVMMISMLVALVFLAGCVPPSLGLHVRGEILEPYLRCGKRCAMTGCCEVGTSVQRNQTEGCFMAQACREFTKKSVPWHLVATRWSCQDDCWYECMVATEEWRKKNKRPLPAKYHGKWAFRRIWGIQELLSCIFSLMNLLAHVHNIVILRKFENKTGYPYKHLWDVYAVSQINAWVWSTVFHVRDTPLTERLDYMSADISVFLGAYIIIERCWSFRPHTRWLVHSLLASGFLRLAYYMLFVKFDYGYNVALCITLGVAQSATWAFCVWREKHQGRYTLWTFFICLYVSMLAEIFDFPPVWKLLDAHALWHAGTIPLTYMWYRFLHSDVEWVSQKHAKAE